MALAIALPALLLLYRQAAFALDVTRSASAYDQAVSRAQSRLAALVGSALAPGDHEGEDGGAYRWRTRVAPVTTLPPQHEVRPGSAFAGGTTLYAVSVSLSWPGPGGTRSVVLETRRLGPAP